MHGNDSRNFSCCKQTNKQTNKQTEKDTKIQNKTKQNKNFRTSMCTFGCEMYGTTLSINVSLRYLFQDRFFRYGNNGSAFQTILIRPGVTDLRHNIKDDDAQTGSIGLKLWFGDPDKYLGWWMSSPNTPVLQKYFGQEKGLWQKAPFITNKQTTTITALDPKFLLNKVVHNSDTRKDKSVSEWDRL